MSVASLAYKINADASSFGREVRFAERRVQRFQRRAESQIRKIGRAFSVMGGLAVTALVAMTKETISQASEMGAAAARVGMLSEEYSALEYAARESKVELEVFEKRIQRFNREVAESEDGTGRLADTLDKYNTEIRKADGSTRTHTDVLMDLSDAVVGAEDSYEKARIAAAAFGSRGAAEMLPFLEQGSAGIEEMTEKADELGLTFSTDLTDAADQIEANFRELRDVGRSFALQIGEQTLPIISRYSGSLVDNANDANSASRSTGALTGALKGTLLVVETLRIGFVVLAETMGMAAAMGVKHMERMNSELEEKGVGRSIADRIPLARIFNHHVRGERIATDATETGAAEREEIVSAYMDNLGDIYSEGAKNIEAILADIDDIDPEDVEGSDSGSDDSGFFPEIDDEPIDHAEERLKELEAIATRWTRDTATGIEKYEMELWKLNDAFEEGLVSQEVYTRALRELEGEYDPFGNIEWNEHQIEMAEAAEQIIAEVNGIDLAAQAHLESLEELYDEGLLTWTEYRAAVDMASEGFSDLDDGITTAQESTSDLMQLAEDGANALSSTLIDAIVDPFNASIEDMVVNFTQAMARMALEAAAQRAIMAAFGGGFSEGGVVPSFADGGFVSGPGTTTSDSIPALLSDQEYVVNADATAHWGLDVMDAINSKRVPKFADGGAVGRSGSGNSSGGGSAPTIKIVNVSDSSEALDAMRSKSGEQVIVNTIQKNRGKLGL